MHRFVSATLATLAISTALFAPGVEAAPVVDQKTYSPIQCISSDAGAIHDGYGLLRNHGTGEILTYCPLINDKDNTWAVNTTVSVHVVDRHYDSDIACHMIEHWNTWTGWYPTVKSSGSNATPQKIEMVVGGNMDITMFFACYLPGLYQGNYSNWSGIDRYTVVEKSGG
jgi:hypothetical protein